MKNWTKSKGRGEVVLETALGMRVEERVAGIAGDRGEEKKRGRR